MTNWMELYPIGSKVVALSPDNKMEEGTITTHTANMHGQEYGLIVRFADGFWAEYGYSFLDEKNPSSDNSFVQVKGV